MIQVKLGFLLAPPAYMSHAPSIIFQIASWANDIEVISKNQNDVQNVLVYKQNHLLFITKTVQMFTLADLVPPFWPL